MSLYFSYVGVGKGVEVDGSLFQNYYGEDFNPTNKTFPSSWETARAYQTTSNFNLSGFQNGHEVFACVCNIKNNGSSARTNSISASFQRYNGGWSTSWVNYFGSITCDPNTTWAMFVYAGIDYDEIRPGYSKYRIVWDMDDDSITSDEFTVSNLSFDSSLHPSGYIWVEGNNLCYTDASYTSSRGYKHKIAYDESYSGAYAGTSNAGKMRLKDATDYCIYYVTKNGYVYRTYPSRERYGGGSSVSSSKKGHIRVSDGDAEDGYAHLCFVANNGRKRRIINGPV